MAYGPAAGNGYGQIHSRGTKPRSWRGLRQYRSAPVSLIASLPVLDQRVSEADNQRCEHDCCSLSRSSSAFTYPRFGPLFLRTSSYAQVWPSRAQVLQLGRTPSHLSFLLRQIMHASLLGFGTLALSMASRPLTSTVGLGDPFCDGALVSIRSLSGGVAAFVDMAIEGGVAEKRRRSKSRSASTCGADEFGLSNASGIGRRSLAG